MQEDEEEFDPRIIELVDEAFKGAPKDKEFNIDKLFDLVGPAPRTVPKVIGLKPSEFMGTTVEHFQRLCEEHTYAKIISALTYIRNVAANGDEEVIQKAVSLQEDLKSWRTNSPPEDQSTPDDQPGPSASSETDPQDQ